MKLKLFSAIFYCEKWGGELNEKGMFGCQKNLNKWLLHQ